MGPELVLHLEIAAVVLMAVIIVAVAVMASGGACDDAAGSAAVHDADVERALGEATLMTYEQAAARKKEKEKGKQQEEEEERCAICLLEYAEGEAGELVRVVPACGHFYHESCGIDKWFRKSRTCPLCRGGLGPPPPTPLPGLPRPECPPMPPRMPPSH
ncbi:E3 ubiquitin-protein ligase EL5-like [Hordeum vulgare subsp. vulgare]|uniref:RING-type domain-containing protein n=1 Tax=Hordeum vulgare subsp. vulgare TaxID=112509 RepID=A0A8I6XW67_HORVV|nr:E3 ubiquitin-protein ligase EL5-like [Hordeum vulgare subsp. vulgare]